MRLGDTQRRTIGSCAAFAGLVAGLTAAAPAIAGAFSIRPVHIKLPANQRATSVTITNSDTVPVSIRVTARAWNQVGGVDVYGPTANVIASPPIFTIAPGKSQIVRVGLQAPAESGAYRVIFEEIPRDASVGGEIQVTLNLDLPLYVLPAGRAFTALGWRARSDASGNLIVEGSNRGSLHSQVIEIRANSAGKSTLSSSRMGVILPGSTRHWNLGKHDGLTVGVPLALSVRGPTAETQANVVLERP